MNTKTDKYPWQLLYFSPNSSSFRQEFLLKGSMYLNVHVLSSIYSVYELCT